MTINREQPGPRRQGLLSALSLIIATIVALGAAELGLRIRAHFKYGTAGPVDELFMNDSTLGGLRVLIPGSHTARIHVNRLGFRGPEITVPKPPNDIRLAFLGASTTYCAEVSSDSMAWPDLVTRSLRAAIPGQPFDFINSGVPGYSMSSMQRIFSGRVAALQPDIVIIYEATNQLYVETRRMAEQQHLWRGAADNESWLARHSLLYFLIDKNLQFHHREDGALAYSPDSLGEGFRSLLTSLVREAQSGGRLVAVATFAQRIREGQTPAQMRAAAASSLYYMPWMTPEGLLRAYERYNTVIREVAAATGALLIEGENDIPSDDRHFNDTVHFKDPGSVIMAQRVTRALLASPAFRAVVAARANSGSFR